MRSVAEKYNDIVLEVAAEFNLKPKYVIKVMNFYYKSVSLFMRSRNLDDPEGFRDVNIPSLFTFVPTYRKALCQMHKYNYRREKRGKSTIDMEDFKVRALANMGELIPELKEKRKKSQSRDNRYNNHRNLINKKRNNENIHNGESAPDHSA